MEEVPSKGAVLLWLPGCHTVLASVVTWEKAKFARVSCFKDVEVYYHRIDRLLSMLMDLFCPLAKDFQLIWTKHLDFLVKE